MLKSTIQKTLNRLGYVISRIDNEQISDPVSSQVSVEEVVPIQFPVRWGKYLANVSPIKVSSKLESLLEGLDEESRRLVLYHWYEVQLLNLTSFHPSLKIDPDFVIKSLPEITQNKLAELFKGWTDEYQAAIRKEFSLGNDSMLLSEVFVLKLGLVFLEDLSGIIEDRVRNKDVIDAGAFWGDSILVLNKELPIRNFYAFEPFPSIREQLENNLEVNDLNSRVTVVPCGLDSKTGTLYMFDFGAGSFLVDNLEDLDLKAKGVTGSDALAIQTTSIDNYLEEHSEAEVGLIKMDIEGQEHAAILGAEQTIRKFKPVLFISIYHDPKDFFDIKPLLESWNPDYRFRVLKLSISRQTELMLIAY